MKEDVTSYLITLMILVMGVVAAWFIMRLASPNTANTISGSETQYAPLQQSILKQ